MFAIGEILALVSAFLWGNSGVILKSLPSHKRVSFIFLESIISGIIILILISILSQWKEFTELDPFVFFPEYRAVDLTSLDE